MNLVRIHLLIDQRATSLYYVLCMFFIDLLFSCGFLKSLDMRLQPETHSEMGSEEERPLFVYILGLVFEREV